MTDTAEDTFAELGIFLALASIGVAGLGIVIVIVVARKRPSALRRHVTLPLGLSLFLGSAALAVAVQSISVARTPLVLGFVVSAWMMGAAIALISISLWLPLIPRPPVAPDLAKRRLNIQYEAQAAGSSFMGTSLVTGEVCSLSEDERSMHTLVTGSTGSGKTTVLKSLFYEAMKRGQPVLIIDPKGNSETIDEFRWIAKAFGRGDKFKLFSIIAPESSCSYNPVARGSSMQVRDRIMGAFEWSEPFYKHQASAWLGLAVDLLKAINAEITISRLHGLLTDAKELDRLEDLCGKHPDGTRRSDLQSRLKGLMKFDKKNLDGLIAQLRDLDNLEFGQTLKPSETTPSIELSQVVRHGEIAYFQLNTMAYEQAAKVIGRLILQDLKALASQVHGGQEKIDKTFFPIFVDEFGSFAFEGFIDFLKMSRDVKFANHLFFQSLSDLDVVSPEFKSQVQQNCLTKIVMRTDDPAEVDFWAGVAGTREGMQASHQVTTTFGIRTKTGQGTYGQRNRCEWSTMYSNA